MHPHGMKIPNVLFGDGVCIEFHCVSFTNVNLAGKVNPDQNKFRIDFDSSNQFLQCVTVVCEKGWGWLSWIAAVHPYEQSKFNCWSQG